MGGRNRLFQNISNDPEYARMYEDTFTRETTFISMRTSQDKFVPGPEMPIPLAFHCAVTLSDRNEVIIYGGATDSANPSNKIVSYHFNNQLWTELPSPSNKCSLIPLFHQTQCALFQAKLLIVPRILCTMVFHVDDQQWIELEQPHFNGGHLITNAKTSLYYFQNRAMYEFKGPNNGWEMWPNELPFPAPP